MQRALTRIDDIAERKQLQEQVLFLNELQLKHYLINGGDVVHCPNSECGYAGVVTIDEQSERIECSAPFVCSKCDTEWRDPLQRAPFSLKSLAQDCLGLPSWENFANNLRKVLMTEPCPNCSVYV